jgi:hypothetical protein
MPRKTRFLLSWGRVRVDPRHISTVALTPNREDVLWTVWTTLP